MAALQKLKLELLYDPADPPLGVYIYIYMYMYLQKN